MTTLQEAPPRRKGPTLPARLPKIQRVPRQKQLNPTLVVVSWILTMISLMLIVMLVNLTVVSQIQHFASQHRLYAQLREDLAATSTPIGHKDVNGNVVALGTPMALLTIPEIGVKEVVVEGTASRETKMGVGHSPETPLPGQPGTSILLGRAAGYGGVFGDLDKLRPGDRFTVVTGQGKSTYQVIGQRAKGEKLPVLGATDGRLTLVTATGSAFLPDGVLKVDAALVSKAYIAPADTVAGPLPDAQKPLAGDPSRLNQLAWLLELMILLTIGAVWAWKRWSHPAMWIVFAPLLTATGLAVADRICDLLPNLM